MKRLLIFILPLFVFQSCGAPGESKGTDNSVSNPALKGVEHRIFVTSATFTGKMGGVTGADALCQQLARQASLDGVYKAIISSFGHDISAHINIDGPVYNYSKASKNLIAKKKSDFWKDFNIERRPIYFDERGRPVSSNQVWTGSTASGFATSVDCLSWRADSSFHQGSTGNASSGLREQIEDSSLNCNSSARLYCISQ